MSFETKIYISAVVLAVYFCLLVTSLIDQKGKLQLFSLSSVLFYCILHAVFSMVTDYLDYTHSNYILQYLFCILYTFSGYMSLFCYGKFYVKTSGVSQKIAGYISAANQVLLIVNLLVTIPLIPSGLFFSVSKDCFYSRGPLFFLSYLFVFLEMLVLAILAPLIQSNRKKAFGYIAFGTFPVVVSILMVFVSLPSNITDVATMLSCIILYSCVYLEERRKALENEAKITKYKSDVMMSQIGPHFLYNTLNTIAALCTVDPEKAQVLTVDFSDYLRTNLNLSKSNRLSSFADELSHTKKYLEIEKVRFGSRLHVEYDIREVDFSLPSLSLQPIVENAVKHGITKKAQGGTVHIATEKQDDCYVVTVADDGVGFDSQALKPQEGHYGFFTTKERLRILLQGNALIESKEGVGTTVTLLIPIK